MICPESRQVYVGARVAPKPTNDQNGLPRCLKGLGEQMAQLFTTIPMPLKTMLDGLRGGAIQLPDFQRGWVWDSDRIRGVLASISRDFPVGAVMMLETGGEITFRTRPVQGVVDPEQKEPDTLILDGQQRLTSLFQATLFGNVVETENAKKQPIKRWYYLDMQRALDKPDEREDAIIAVDQDRKIVGFGGKTELDVSTPELEFEKLMFPFSSVFDPSDWRTRFNAFWKHAPERTKFFDRFEKEIIDRFKQYQLPVITLTDKVSKEAVCHVFEKVNTGGITLTAFELLTATYAAQNFALREDWFGPGKKADNTLGIKLDFAKHKVLRKVSNTDFLQTVALLQTYRRNIAARKGGVPEDRLPAVGGTRASILNIPLSDYISLRVEARDAFIAAGQFVREQYIFRARDLPYQSQLVPLAAIIATLGRDWEDHGYKTKLSHWYWCGVLGELYGGATETRFARDLVEVVIWIKNSGPDPKTVLNSAFNPNRLNTLRSRGSAAYKGIYALLMRQGGKDFRTSTPITAQVFEDQQIDIHHIFPQKWCKAEGINAKIYNSIINKTAICARTNRMIGGKAPSKYLGEIENRAGITRSDLDATLTTHLIDPALLRQDTFNEFMSARRKDLLSLISGATGGHVGPAIEEPEPNEVDSEDIDEDSDDAVEEAA